MWSEIKYLILHNIESQVYALSFDIFNGKIASSSQGFLLKRAENWETLNTSMIRKFSMHIYELVCICLIHHMRVSI